MSPRRLITSLLLAFSFVVITAPVRAAGAEDELIWRGDQATGRAIMDDLAKEYAKQKKGRITLQPFSTLSGLDAVAQGSADLAGSARGKYAGRPEEANINFIPVALDAAVPITHPRNPVSSLTLRQIYDIYYGRITNWKELGGSDTPINLYGIAAPLDGVEFSTRELVFRNGDQRVAVPRLYLNTTKLEEAIAIDPAGLGLSTLGSTAQNKGVKLLGVEGVQPSTATIGDASYPLYITLYLADRVDSPKREAIDRFVAFLGTPAAKDILRRHQLIPYADAGNVIAHDAERMAFIDAHIGRALVTVAAAPATATPVSAPRAMLEAKKAIAPTAESTEQARANLARAEEKKAAAKTPVAKTAIAATPKKAATPTPAKTKVASVPAKSAAKKTTVAKAATPKKEPARKPVSFGNVSGGVTGN